jgi:hypothetical protein
LFGSTNVTKLTTWAYNWDTSENSSVTTGIPGTGVGEYTTPTLPLSDGYVGWISAFRFDGTITPGEGRTWIEQPRTTVVDTDVDFVLDRVAPNTNMIVTQTNETADSVTLNLSNAVFDATSGLKRTTLHINNTDTGTVSTVQQHFPLVADSFIGSRDPQSVNVPVTVNKFVNYEFYAVTEDVSGNVATSSVSTHVEMTPPSASPADVTASTFTVVSPCTIAAANANGGICPDISVALVIENAGGAIVPGEDVPYVVEYRLAGETTWQTSTSDAWEAGIPSLGTTPTISHVLSGLPYGNHFVRARLNSPENTGLAEAEFANNVSAELPVAIAPGQPGIDLTVMPNLIRSGDTVSIGWSINAPYPTTCLLTGGGLNQTINHVPPLSSNTISPTTVNTITNRQLIRLTCGATSVGGFPIPEATATSLVNVVPLVQEF